MGILCTNNSPNCNVTVNSLQVNMTETLIMNRPQNVNDFAVNAEKYCHAVSFNVNSESKIRITHAVHGTM